MRNTTTKRVFGAVLATGLAATATVALAATSEAAAAKYKVDATTSVGQTITLTGKDFVNENGSPQFDVAGIRFTSTTCAATKPTAAATNAAGSGSFTPTNAVAVSDTKITLDTTGFTPTLVAGKAKYTVCVYDTSGDLAGNASTTFYAIPATLSAGNLLVGATAVTNANYATVLLGSSLGGTKVTVKGQDFTSKTVVTVGTKALTGAKIVLGKTSSDLDVITGLTPAGTGTAAAVVIQGEFGKIPLKVTGVNAAAALTWAYKPAVTVSPSGSDGVVGRVVTLKGVGFNSRSFVSASGAGTGGGKSVVYLTPGGVAQSAYIVSNNSATPTNAYICQSPVVDSDTELSCTLPASVADGAYTVTLVTFTGAGGAQTVDTTNTTGYTRGSTYTVAAF